MLDSELIRYCKRAYSFPNVECSNGAEAYVAHLGESLVVAFSGTDSLLDAVLDIWAIPWKPSVLGVWLHRGIWKQTSAIYEKLEPLLEKEIPIHLTGHSLGGGIAQQLACLLLKDGYEVASITTFGSMRAGFQGLTELTKNISGKRYVRDGDTVPDLPPSIFLYKHDRPETLLKGDESYFGDHGLHGYESALTIHTSAPQEGK